MKWLLIIVLVIFTMSVPALLLYIGEAWKTRRKRLGSAENLRTGESQIRPDHYSDGGSIGGDGGGE